MRCFRACLMIWLLIVVFGASPALAADSAGQGFDPDSIVSVWIDGVHREALVFLTELGVDIDGVWGDRARAYIPAERFQELESLGFKLTAIPNPIKRNPGLRAGYHTFSELTAELQSIAAAHPNLCRLESIGDSTNGRELWFMKISDNVTQEEDEPEFKYISTMHGDEPVGMELCINLINLLVDQYGSDPQITRLVDEVEIWIMPLMNPDGYTSSSRYNAQGRDLNRDFPDRVDDPYNTTTGRGTETRHVMNWAFNKSSALSANFHTGALVVNYPYDSDPNPWASYSATPDDALFREQSLTYSRLNAPMYNSHSFNNGITNGIAWYLVYGGMQDWNYVWMGCNEVTIELSNTKWPSYSQIAGLWNDNRDAMLAYMELCLEGVRGSVTDAVSGMPLDATVEVVGKDHEVYTDPEVGDYHRMLLPGTYSLRFSASGYQTKTFFGVSVGSGDATRLDVGLLQTGLSEPVPDLKVNGSNGPITINTSQNLTVTVALNPASLNGVSMDWWVFVDTPMGIYSYSAGGGGRWRSTAEPERTYSGGLFNLSSTSVLSMSGLPKGTYVFTFAIDALNDTYEGSFIDTAQVTVN